MKNELENLRAEYQELIETLPTNTRGNRVYPTELKAKIKYLLKHGVDMQAISKTLNISPNTLYTWAPKNLVAPTNNQEKNRIAAVLKDKTNSRPPTSRLAAFPPVNKVSNFKKLSLNISNQQTINTQLSGGLNNSPIMIETPGGFKIYVYDLSNFSVVIQEMGICS